jgi:hypothetical protein
MTDEAPAQTTKRPEWSVYLPAVTVALVIFGVGYFVGERAGELKIEKAAAVATIKAEVENRKLNEETVNGWASAVTYLSGRLRDGWRPVLPGRSDMPTNTAPGAACGPDARPADPGPFTSGTSELTACRSSLDAVVERCQQTTLQLRGLQTWAK